MKIVIGGIIGGLVVTAIVIWFFVLTDAEYEIVEEITMHPCQKLVLEILDADLELRYYSEIYSESNGQLRYNLVSEPLERETALKEKFLNSDCYDDNNKAEWVTVEFKEKLMILNHEGFHP